VSKRQLVTGLLVAIESSPPGGTRVEMMELVSRLQSISFIFPGKRRRVVIGGAARGVNGSAGACGQRVIRPERPLLPWRKIRVKRRVPTRRSVAT
jgi:hypothetical protein